MPDMPDPKNLLEASQLSKEALKIAANLYNQIQFMTPDVDTAAGPDPIQELIINSDDKDTATLLLMQMQNVCLVIEDPAHQAAAVKVCLAYYIARTRVDYAIKLEEALHARRSESP